MSLPAFFFARNSNEERLEDIVMHPTLLYFWVHFN